MEKEGKGGGVPVQGVSDLLNVQQGHEFQVLSEEGGVPPRAHLLQQRAQVGAIHQHAVTCLLLLRLGRVLAGVRRPLLPTQVP